MVIKFTCEYNGKDFCGFQRQARGRSVQQVLEDALTRYFGEKIVIHGSGRTDAGVHAREQVCSFAMRQMRNEANEVNLGKIEGAVNSFLPSDVAVRDFQIMPDGFHARYSVKRKTYLYRVYVARYKSPLREEYYHKLHKVPEVESMRQKAAAFKGCDIVIESRGDDEIWFWVSGPGFKYRMVRRMVGELIYEKPQTAPSKGLTLYSVEY